jgi:predicted MFS family arabinose efflux permease
MAKQAIGDPLVFGWSWPIFGAAAAASTVAAAVLSRFAVNRRLWILGHLVMALGVALPVFWPGVVGIMLAALLVGGTFMVITMAGMQEARLVAGEHARALMAAMTSAFALGQIAGPLGVSFVVDADGGFSVALLVAASLLAASAYALAHRCRGGLDLKAAAGCSEAPRRGARTRPRSR